MSTIKANAVTGSTTNNDLALTGNGSGVVKIGDGALKFPDADSTAGYFLKTNGSAQLSFAAASGGWSFIEKVVASGSSALVFAEGSLASGYDYIILCRDVQMSGDSNLAQSIHLQFGTGGTPTYQTSGYVGTAFRSGPNDPEDTENDTTAGCVIAGYNDLGGASGELWDAEVLIPDPVANTKSRVRSLWNGQGNTDRPCHGYAVFHRTTADIATGLKILPGTGTITTGDFILVRRTTA